MKTKVVALAMLAWLATSIAVPAKKIPSKPFFMPQPVTLGGAEIPEGMYQLSLETTSDGVQVKLWKDGRFMATGHGTWVKNGVKYKDNAILLRVNQDGTRSLLEIRVAGSAKSVVLDSKETTVQSSSK